MDLQSLMYFRELTKDLNMSRCASRLHVSQQTLSSNILRLESEYGIKFFQRKPVFILTEAGQHMLEFADKIFSQEAQLKNIFSDINHQEIGTIRFGANTGRSNCCLPAILPIFSERYPKIQVQLTDASSDNLKKKVLDGEVDYALVAVTDDVNRFHQEFTSPYHLYLCISEELLDKYYGKEKEKLKQKSKQGAHLKDFTKLPFLLFSAPNVIGGVINKCCQEEKITLKKYMSTPYSDITPLVCANSIAACIMSQDYWSSPYVTVPPNINVFPLADKTNKPVTLFMALICRKDQYISCYAKDFISLLRNFFLSIHNNNPTHLAKIIKK